MSDENKNPNATLAGGIETVVILRDGSTEKVLVRELAVEDYPKLFVNLGSELRQVEIYCDKPEGWGKTLKPISHNEVMKVAEQINKESFFGWSLRQLEKGAKLMPGAMDGAIRTAIASHLPNGSPTSPSAAGSVR